MSYLMTMKPMLVNDELRQAIRQREAQKRAQFEAEVAAKRAAEQARYLAQIRAENARPVVRPTAPLLTVASLAPAPAQPVPLAKRPVKERWESAIAERMQRGMTRYQAIIDIGQTDKALYQEYRRS